MMSPCFLPSLSLSMFYVLLLSRETVRLPATYVCQVRKPDHEGSQKRIKTLRMRDREWMGSTPVVVCKMRVSTTPVFRFAFVLTSVVTG